MLLKNLPKQINFIVWNEACERYSYYGMRSILVVFLTQYFMLSSDVATRDYHLFVSLCYLTPLLGAYLSDRFLGKYKTIMLLSLVYCLGHAFLAIFEQQQTGFYTGLFLIALGSGGIKPCVSAHVGDQFQAGQEDKLRKVFDIFYWMINFGSTLSSLITPWTLEAYGPAIAFGIPGILMFLATFVFWLGRHYYVHVPPTGPNPHSTMRVLFSGLGAFVKNKSSFWEQAALHHPQVMVDDVKAALSIGKIFLAVTLFWALFDQHGSSWVLQAQKMDLVVEFLGQKWTMLAAQLPALNPIMVMILIPITSKLIYPAIEKKFKTELTPLGKMTFGMFLASVSFVPVAICEYLLDSGIVVHALWQLIPYLLITLSEVMISITGLEFAYTQAPKSMKSTIMSFWLLTVFFGNFLTAIIADINIFTGGHFFVFFAVLMGVFAFIFRTIASNYQHRSVMGQ